MSNQQTDQLKPELERELDGFRENALALAVRLGIDPETMSDAQTWHASAEAISTLQDRQKKLVEALKKTECKCFTRYAEGFDQAGRRNIEKVTCVKCEALRDIGEGDNGCHWRPLPTPRAALHPTPKLEAQT